VPTEVREHEGRGHTFRAGVLLYLGCIAVCAIFFSLGFLVGFNEHGSHSGPATEVVAPPAVIPPTINPPPDGGQIPSQDPSAGNSAPNAVPETEVIPDSGGGTVSNPPAEEPPRSSPHKKHSKAEIKAEAKAAAKAAPTPPPAAARGEAGEGLTLQVAALRTKQDAEAMVGVLKKRGYPVFMAAPAGKHSEDSLYRVQVGPFRTKAEADKAHDKLTAEGFKPFIKH
jgi:cell division septation protein DedD